MKKLTSLKWEIGKYLIIFCILTASIVFLFQIVLLQPMYEANKIKSIETVGSFVEKFIEDERLDEFVDYIQSQSDTCIMVYQSSSSGGMQGSIGNRGCMISSITNSERAKFVTKAIGSKNHSYLARVTNNSSDFGVDGDQGDNFDTIVYTKIVNAADYSSIIMVSGNITPLNATTETLASQMRYIALFMIVAVAILTLLMYRHIAKPIIGITSNAKQLPQGKYTIDPKTNRYKEAADLNNTLVQAANDIQKADKAKRDLISNVSHDLRTPLTMIGGYGEMMIDLPEEKTDENIQVIVDETKRLNALVNDLLDMSRLQDGRIVLHKEVFDISALLKTQLQKYDVYRMQEGYTIESELLDTIYVNADKKRIEQVINNFLNNAVNYGGEAKHIIVREIKKENVVRIEVQDFGEGIDPEDLDNIWDRYYKVDKEHVRVANGSGIGLNIVKQLLELHGVPYGVKSSKGKGSTFYFEMPIEKGNQ
ncbi:MAG: HAMP domain-containing sensor histidine kinase [Bulleidia sp.]|nr:HAMP domain-containing histidine kinase [Erysipelotrichaceae bacterium]MDY3660057.1 HAMP domain-containing sensor histidine kinase [Bulleidia sp.]